MSDPTLPSAILDGRTPDGGRIMQSAFVRVFASLVTAVVIFAVTLLVWAHHERLAARMIVDAQKAPGYLSLVSSQIVTMPVRPNGY